MVGVQCSAVMGILVSHEVKVTYDCASASTSTMTEVGVQQQQHHACLNTYCC